MTATREAAPVTRPAPPTEGRPFAALAAATLLALFVQAITAGQFVQHEGRDSWVTVHGVIADVSWVLALATAAVGYWRLRHTAPRLVFWAGALFALTLAQTGVGHLITDEGQDGWITVHIPLAVLIFGLSTWLTVRAVRWVRRPPAAP